MKNRLAVLLGTWFYSGLIPPVVLTGMAGTYGSLFSVPLCYVLLVVASQGVVVPYYLTVGTIFLLGLWSVPRAEFALGPRTDWRGKTKVRDQNQIVIDEMFGMLVTCYPLILMGVRPHWLNLGLAFALFRLFDIVKVPPARFFDNMKNVFGVMLDDLVAAVYAGAVLYLVLMLF
ncbi:MAG: phosphatidylglycerophosphatase A [Candidatus Brennerbacteria bacterium]|nr:phosphatidylglycerophosphatase A [Candidatus Brennerbacteria bacterium]